MVQVIQPKFTVIVPVSAQEDLVCPTVRSILAFGTELTDIHVFGSPESGWSLERLRSELDCISSESLYIHWVDSRDVSAILDKMAHVIKEAEERIIVFAQPGAIFAEGYADAIYSSLSSFLKFSGNEPANEGSPIVFPLTNSNTSLSALDPELSGNSAGIELGNGYNVHDVSTELKRLLSPSPIPALPFNLPAWAMTQAVAQNFIHVDPSIDSLFQAMICGLRSQMDKGSALLVLPHWFVFWKRTLQAKSVEFNASSLQDLTREKEDSPPLNELVKHYNSSVSSPDAWKTRDLLRNRLRSLRTLSNGQLTPSPNKAPRHKIMYILPKVDTYGGVISVIQLINQLNTLGFDANLATYGTVAEQIFSLAPTYFRPYVFPNAEVMIDEFPDCDLVVATHWTTVAPAVTLKQLRPELSLVYFIQDYEPDFYDDALLKRQAERTYRLIKDQIVKTRWLRDKVSPFGGKVNIIPLGLNLNAFFPRSGQRDQRIISMVRKSSRHRNYSMALRVFEELSRRRPGLELAVYGMYDEGDIKFPAVSLGRLPELNLVASEISRSTILFDCSTFQGFGRPGLEAMACGTAAVVTREGGITQYAQHGSNCLLIDPNNIEDIITKIFYLLDNREARLSLVSSGLRTAQEYSHHNEGKRTFELFSHLLGNQ